MDKNYMKTILSGIKEWTRSLIQKTANNVQRTAETAQKTAETAQKTADTAQKTADTAQATADNAQATADDAQATADDALHLQISYDDQILIWDGTTTTTESTVQVEYFTQVAKSGSTKKTRYYRISNIPDNIVKYAFAHYKDIKCAIKVQNGTENELELTNDWYVDSSGLCVSSSNYYIFIARESGSHAVRIPGALQPTWIDFPQAGIYIGYCTDSSVEGDAGKSFTHKIALPTYGLPLDSVILTTDSDKNIQVVDTETGTKKTLKSAYAYAQEGGYTGTEAEFATKLAAEKLPNPYPLTFTGAVSGSYDGSSAKTIEIPSGGGGGNNELTLLADINFDGNTAIGFEYTDLDDVSEIYIVGGEIKSGLDNSQSRFSLKINDIEISASAVLNIQKASGTDTWNSYYIAKFNGVFWEPLRSPDHGGANPVVHTAAPLYPNSVVLNVGKAKKLYLYVANPSYKPVAGWMKIWVR